MNTIAVCANADRVSTDVIINLPLDVYVIHQSDESSACKMAQVNATIVRLVYKNGFDKEAGKWFESYRMMLDTKVKGFVKDADGNFVEQDVDYVDWIPSVLMAQAINTIDGLGNMYQEDKQRSFRNNKPCEFGITEMNAILSGASITFENTLHHADEEYTNQNGEVIGKYSHDGYTNTITDIEVVEAVDKILAHYRQSIDDILARFIK